MFPFFPYSDMYTLNLDWVVKAATDAKKATENIAAFAGVDAVAHTADDASVDLDIVDNHYRFTFGLPRGLPGVPGLPGADGEDGRNGNQFIFGSLIDGHTDGVPFNAPASIQRTFQFGDIYINTNSGNAYHVTTAGTGAAAKLVFLFNMKGQSAPVEQIDIKFESVPLTRQDSSLAAFTREPRATLGTITVPPHSAAVLTHIYHNYYYFITSSVRCGDSVNGYEFFKNSTDTAYTAPISGFVYNCHNTAHSDTDLGKAYFLIFPDSVFSRYAVSASTESGALNPTMPEIEMNENETGTPQTMPNVIVEPTFDNGLS